MSSAPNVPPPASDPTSPFPIPIQISLLEYTTALARLKNRKAQVDTNPNPSACSGRQDVFIETKISRPADAGGDAVLRTYFCSDCVEHVGSALSGVGEEGVPVEEGGHRFLRFREGGH